MCFDPGSDPLLAIMAHIISLPSSESLRPSWSCVHSCYCDSRCIVVSCASCRPTRLVKVVCCRLTCRGVWVAYWFNVQRRPRHTALPERQHGVCVLSSVYRRRSLCVLRAVWSMRLHPTCPSRPIRVLFGIHVMASLSPALLTFPFRLGLRMGPKPWLLFVLCVTDTPLFFAARGCTVATWHIPLSVTMAAYC
jgi:hypothetical protein